VSFSKEFLGESVASIDAVGADRIEDVATRVRYGARDDKS
jgi:hypothetical protein